MEFRMIFEKLQNIRRCLNAGSGPQNMYAGPIRDLDEIIALFELVRDGEAVIFNSKGGVDRAQ